MSLAHSISWSCPIHSRHDVGVVLLPDHDRLNSAQTTSHWKKYRSRLSRRKSPATPARRELSAGDGADDEKRLSACSDRFRQRHIGRFVGHIFANSEETHQRTTLFADVIANGATQGGIAGF